MQVGWLGFLFKNINVMLVSQAQNRQMLHPSISYEVSGIVKFLEVGSGMESEEDKEEVAVKLFEEMGHSGDG